MYYAFCGESRKHVPEFVKEIYGYHAVAAINGGPFQKAQLNSFVTPYFGLFANGGWITPYSPDANPEEHEVMGKTGRDNMDNIISINNGLSMMSKNMIGNLPDLVSSGLTGFRQGYAFSAFREYSSSGHKLVAVTDSEYGNPENDESIFGRNAQRSLVGLDYSGNIYFISVYGAGNTPLGGMTGQELLDFLNSNEVTSQGLMPDVLVNLDGGGSSYLWFAEESDLEDAGPGLRTVTDAVVLYLKD